MKQFVDHAAEKGDNVDLVDSEVDKWSEHKLFDEYTPIAKDINRLEQQAVSELPNRSAPIFRHFEAVGRSPTKAQGD